MDDAMKNVLITGATGNLGTRVVDRFVSSKEYNVIVTTSGRGPQASSSVTAYSANLIDEYSAAEMVSKVIANHSRIDAVVLLVGGFAMGGFAESDGATFKKMLALNFESAYNVVRPVLEQMKKQPEGGRMVLIGARPSLRPKDGKNMIAYALSKSLIFKLAELVNAEGVNYHVTASVIVPSTIDTETNRAAMPNADFSKWVDPADIASSIFYLCSDQGKALRETVLKMYGDS
jgi:NAD(P)-dependent dehydrogenase (short-subunit alcohol dehydrogenase family)